MFEFADKEKSFRFEIHLHSVTNRRTVPFLISFRPSENDIVFNSMIRGVWDHERRRIVPVDLTTLFTIEIYLFPIHFLVVINDEWFHQQHYSRGTCGDGYGTGRCDRPRCQDVQVRSFQ